MEAVAADGRELTVQGLDDPDGSNPEGDPEFLAFGDVDDFRPEHMVVYRCLTVSGGVLSYHADRAVGSHIPTTGSGWLQAASLSFTGASAYDVRGPLLALMRWQWPSELPACLAYGIRYLTVWCQRVKKRPRPEVIAAAVSDALMLVYWGRMKRASQRNPVAIPTVEKRRIELKVDKGRFETYRNLMVVVFQRRLSEASRRYKMISHYRPVQNTDYRGKGFRHRFYNQKERNHGPVLTLFGKEAQAYCEQNPAIKHPF